MTLVLRYADQHRLIDVADRRITEMTIDDVVTGHTDDAVKAFFARGFVVSYSGLHELADGLSTRAWVEDALMAAGGTELRQALDHLASVLPSVIAPPLRHEALDIRLTGVALVNEPGWVSVVDGFVSNVDGHAPAVSYESAAVQRQISTEKPYEAYGANLAAGTKAYLDEQIHEATPTIDIVNAFLTAIRRTSLTAPDDSVGKSATASVIPLQLLANAAGTREIEFAARDDGMLADEVVSFTRAACSWNSPTPTWSVMPACIRTQRQAAGGFVHEFRDGVSRRTPAFGSTSQKRPFVGHRRVSSRRTLMIMCRPRTPNPEAPRVARST